MTFGVHYYDKKGREVTGTQFYKTACEERDNQITALEEQVQKLAALAEERRVFIVNGAEMGYIQLPVFDDDPATATYQRCLLKPKLAADAVIREIGVKAVEEFAEWCWDESSSSGDDYRLAAEKAEKYAAKLREGEQP